MILEWGVTLSLKKVCSMKIYNNNDDDNKKKKKLTIT